MKKLLLCIIIAIMAIPLLSCSDEEPAPPAAIDFVGGQGGQGGQDDSSLNFSHQSSTQNVVFSSNYDWTATPSDEWIKVTPESGKAGEKCEIVVSLDANDTYEKRSGSIVINAKELNVVLTVSQEQNNAIILSTPTVNLPQAGGAFTVKLKANIDYEYEIKADWIKSVETRALTEHSLRFEAEANPSYDKREGEIIIKGDGFSETVTVTQAQTNILTLSTTQQNFACSGGEFSVKVQYNVDYKVKISDSWVTQIESRAIETSTLRFAVAGNTTDERRTATITISGGNITEVITVSQDRLSLQNNELYYTSSDGKIIEPYQTMGFSANIVSNTYSNGRGVIVFDKDITAISEYAFYNCTKLTSIKMPKSITKIREYAFYESGLTNIEIPSNVTEIATYAFYSTNIVNLVIPDSITSIGSSAFRGCTSLTSITIPDSVTSIGGSAFAYCRSLTSITIPDSVTSIGKSAFSGCSSLTSITIPDSVTSIGDYAFYCCTSLTSVTIPDSVTSIGDYPFVGCTSLESITIPDSVTSIGDYAFNGCTSLTSITIPDSVTSIEGWAFSRCSSLTSITIGNSVTSIGDGAFYGCTSLTSVTIGNSVTEIGGSAFYDCTGELIINSKIVETDYAYNNSPANSNNGWLYCAQFTKVTIGNSVTSIGGYAFSYCSSLTSVTIGNSVTWIGNSAFRDCSSLTSVTIPDSVTSIVEYAFSGCTSMTSVTIPDSVTSIGMAAFEDCSSLTSITIPDSVTSIEGWAFYGCSSLTCVYCKPITPPTGEYDMFYNNASGRKIYVPRNSVEAYKSASYWSDYASYIVGYDFE